MQIIRSIIFIASLASTIICSAQKLKSLKENQHEQTLKDNLLRRTFEKILFEFEKAESHQLKYNREKALIDFQDSIKRVFPYRRKPDYSSNRFRSHADFSDVIFLAGANFSDSQFDSTALFFSSQLMHRMNFARTNFNSLAYFFFAEFHVSADFSYAHFNGRADFESITLPDTLIFEKVKTNSIIDLSAVQLDSTAKAKNQYCFIDLRDAPIEKFKLRYDKFRVYWPDQITTSEYERLTNVYEGLLNNFKDYGYLTSYATLDKEYQAFKDLQNPDASEVKKLLNKINYYWNNYGYSKERIWLWTVFFLAISTLLNWLAFPYLVKELYPLPMIDKALFDNRPENRAQFKGSAFLKGKVHLNFRYLIYAFYYTILIFFGLKLTTERINFKMHGGVAIIFTEYLIGLICLGYLANFIISSGLIGK